MATILESVCPPDISRGNSLQALVFLSSTFDTPNGENYTNKPKSVSLETIRSSFKSSSLFIIDESLTTWPCLLSSIAHLRTGDDSNYHLDLLQGQNEIIIIKCLVSNLAHGKLSATMKKRKGRKGREEWPIWGYWCGFAPGSKPEIQPGESDFTVPRDSWVPLGLIPYGRTVMLILCWSSSGNTVRKLTTSWGLAGTGYLCYAEGLI